MSNRVPATDAVRTGLPATGTGGDAEAAVAVARIVVVGTPCGADGTAAVEAIGGADVGPVVRVEDPSGSNGDPPWSSAQPHQLWLIEPGAHDEVAARVAELGATVVRPTSPTELWVAVLAWAARAREQSEHDQRALLRENTLLRRELNRALSALGPTHQVLGLMPSVTLDQFRAERRPTVALQPEDPEALMAKRWHPLVAREVLELERQMDELRQHIEAMEQTRIMRWSRIPRRAYARVRGDR